MPLSQVFSDRTGRNGWAYSGPLSLVPTTPPEGAGSAPLRIVGLPEAGTGTPGVWSWTWLDRPNPTTITSPATRGTPLMSSPPSGTALPAPAMPATEAMSYASPTAPWPRIVELTDDEDDGAPAGTPASRGNYRRTGPYTAELDGSLFALHESPGDDDRSAGALLSALRYTAPEALRDAGIDTPEAFRDWLGRTVTDTDVSEATVPSLDQRRTVPLSLLQRIGVKLGTSQQTQGALLGDALPVSEVTRGPETTLSPVQRFQVLMSDLSYARDGVGIPMEALLGTAARALGVAVALAGPDGELTFHGGPTGSAAPPVLLVRDGDRHLAGLPLDATEWPDGARSDGTWSDGPADREAAPWLAAHRDTLEDVRDGLVALGPDAVLDADGGSVTPEPLEHLNRAT